MVLLSENSNVPRSEGFAYSVRLNRWCRRHQSLFTLSHLNLLNLTAISGILHHELRSTNSSSRLTRRSIGLRDSRPSSRNPIVGSEAVIRQSLGRHCEFGRACNLKSASHKSNEYIDTRLSYKYITAILGPSHLRILDQQPTNII